MRWPASSSSIRPTARLPVAESAVWLAVVLPRLAAVVGMFFPDNLPVGRAPRPNTLVCPGRRQAARVMSDCERCSRGFVAPLAGHPFTAGRRLGRSFGCSAAPVPFSLSPLPSYTRGLGGIKWSPGTPVAFYYPRHVIQDKLLIKSSLASLIARRLGLARYNMIGYQKPSRARDHG